MRSSVFVVASCLALVASAPLAAHAQGETAHDAAVSEFTLGRVKFEAGDCAGAIPHFVKSLELEQNVGARFNLAVCSAREGRAAEAWNHYKAAEQLAIAKKDAKRTELAHNAAAELDRKVLKVRLVLPSDTTVKLTIDGRAVPPTDHWIVGTSYALEPGVPHAFVVEIPGQPKPWTKNDVRGEAGVELPAMVVEVERPKETIVLREETRTPPLRTVSYVVGAAGLASLAAGGVFAILAASSRSDAKSACETGLGSYVYPSSCNPLQREEIDPANDSAQSRAGVATVMTITGAALVGTGVVMFFLSRPTTRQVPKTGIVLAPSFGGASLGGTF
ncbi:MAG: tetratricopeptide repeat protein [Deltaproteobacteria bacterium]|nr:tetratricopeptide repeat protein [Deltaproteobacteria bacterium]